MKAIDVEYVVRDGAAIAFEVFGDGPVDLLVTQHLCPIDLLWELPQLAGFMEALGRMARVIAFDARGHGASDPLATTAGAGGMESSADDLQAVLDAAGADRVTILEQFGTQAVTFAATYPERVRSLIIMHPRSSFPELRGRSESSALASLTHRVARRTRFALVDG